jgi:hypothetical protein
MSQSYDLTIQLRVGARDGVTRSQILAGVEAAVRDVREQQDPATAWWAESAAAVYANVGDGLAAEQERDR